MRYRQSDIEKVLDATAIEDVVRDYVGADNLRKEGSRYKCCCPVHNEDTPSFVVTPSKGIYKCFGCGIGGNALSFLQKVAGMTFPEAIEKLAKDAGIRLEKDETPLTAEEVEKERVIRLSYEINQASSEWFAEQLYSDNDKARFALDYAEKRWGEFFVKEAGLGFDPGNGAYIKWAESKGFSRVILQQLGLRLTSKNNKPYCPFFNRLIMPIKSRTGKVVGFIGRNLNDDKPKYKNSSDSPIFKKDEILFGLDTAVREAMKSGVMYLVEGCPDVYRLQSIGVENTVACMGTAWSKNHFATLTKYVPSVCFIPDMDSISQSEQFGAGVKAVLKAGVIAMEAGLSVMVKEIPQVNAKQKADADSYFKSKMIFDEILRQDFVVWYAEKKLRGKDTGSERAAVMKDVARLMALVKDKNYLKILQKKVAHLLNVSIGILQSSVNEAVKSNAEKKHAGGDKMMARELYSRYGFYESKNCYYALGKDGIEQRWSNFKLEPLFHIKDQLNPKRLFKITNIFGQTEIVEMKQEDLISVQRFRLKTSGLGNYIWEAKEEQLIKLQYYLYEKTETAVEVTQLGWQKDDFFAYGNGAWYQGEWYPVDEFGIVRLPSMGNYYLPAASKIYKMERRLFQFERKFVHLDTSEVSFRTYTDKMIEVFGDNAKVGLCFFLAALFKDIVTAKTKNFPLLNLFGPKGSGKSELGHSLMSFFIVNNEPPNLSTATDAALADAVAQCSNALVHIDEYKNTIELSRREFLKSLYDGVGRTRMNMDRDKKRETTAVDSAIILSGQEMPTIDIAIFSRMVYLTFDKTVFSPEKKRWFEELKTMRDMGCSHMVLELLAHRRRVQSGFSSSYNAAMEDIEMTLGGSRVEDRIFRNWTTILAIFRTLEGAIDISPTYKEMLKICVDGIVRQSSVCNSTNELASFWQTVDFLHQDGAIFIDADYRIRHETSFKGKGSPDKIEFKGARRVLYLRSKRVMVLYRKNGKTMGEATLPVESLRHYLEISEEFLGMKNAVRFKNLSNPMESHVQTTAANGQTTVRQTSQVDWALCFDYDKLVQNYGINLEVDTGMDDNIDPIDIDENDTSSIY